MNKFGSNWNYLNKLTDIRIFKWQEQPRLGCSTYYNIETHDLTRKIMEKNGNIIKIINHR